MATGAPQAEGGGRLGTKPTGWAPKEVLFRGLDQGTLSLRAVGYRMLRKGAGAGGWGLRGSSHSAPHSHPHPLPLGLWGRVGSSV